MLHSNRRPCCAMRKNITVIKRNHLGQELWRYEGHVLKENPKGVLIEALFNRDDLPFHGLTFKRNDRFVELYLKEHWFNIYAVHDNESDELKAWYCNVTRPAIYQDGQIAYDDLALDLLVYPDGRQLVLDQDEFENLNLPSEDSENAKAGLAELMKLLKNPAQFSLDELLERD